MPTSTSASAKKSAPAKPRKAAAKPKRTATATTTPLSDPAINELCRLRRRYELRRAIGPDDWAKSFATLGLDWAKLRDQVDAT